MGWDQLFPLVDSCPNKKQDRSSVVLDFVTYRRQANQHQMLSLVYRQCISQQTKWKSLPSVSHRQVVVHIRRGDVSPCGNCESCVDRYLPNQHFKQVIEQYSREGDDITIYSERESFEPWDDLGNNIKLVLDQDIYTMWSHMASADVLVLSKSSFSYVPALLNLQGQVVYTPYWNEPMDGWTFVPDDILRATRTKMSELQASCNRL